MLGRAVQLKTRGFLRVAGVSGAIEGKEEGGASRCAFMAAERQLGSHFSSKLRFCYLRSLHTTALQSKLRGALQSPQQQVAPSC